MAEKTKINEHGDVIFSEEDAIDLLYTDPDFDLSKLYFDDIDKYSQSLKELGIDLPVINTAPKRPDRETFDQHNCGKWHMPDCLLYTSPSPRDQRGSRMPSCA